MRKDVLGFILLPALPANDLLTLSLQAPWSHLSSYSIVLFGMERKRSAFCRKNRSKAQDEPSLPLRHAPPCPIHSPYSFCEALEEARSLRNSLCFISFLFC